MKKHRRLAVLKRDKYTCFLCGAKLVIGHPSSAIRATIDHFIPASSSHWKQKGGRQRRGKHAMQNLRACCSDCNVLKDNIPMDDKFDVRFEERVKKHGIQIPTYVVNPSIRLVRWLGKRWF
jgi:5-methylcytosine-specific restriction endonuclease McrA